MPRTRPRSYRRAVSRFRRLLTAFVLLGLGLGAALCRLAWVEVARYKPLAEAAVAQRAQTVPLGPTRGRILDRHGIPLSDGQLTYRVAAYPAVVASLPAQARNVLARALGIRPTELVGRLAAAGGAPVYLAEGLDGRSVGRISGLGLEGVAVVADEERYGPAALAVHAVGYLSGAEGSDGLEKAWNQYLGGQAPQRLALFVDGRGRPMEQLGWRKLTVWEGTSPWTGLPCDLVTTIDADLQAAVEEALAAKVPRGAAVVAEPGSGDVLAMASRPVFDQGNVAAALGRSDGALLDRCLAAYSPGSVVKPLVLAAAIDAGIVRPGEVFECDGEAVVDGHQVSCTAKARGGHGKLTVEDALACSCNVVFAEIGARLGQDRLSEWLAKFGVGRATGVGLPGEAAGALPAFRAQAAEPEAAFGQGSVTATPLQVALAFSALANGGRLPGVGLAEELRSPIGAEARVSGRGGSPAPGGRVVSGFAAAAVTAALDQATREGTGRAAAVTGDVAGKTGTAETGRTGSGGQELYDGWYAGFWPSYAPRYVIVVLVEDTPVGGATAAGVFGDILSRILDLEAR